MKYPGRGRQEEKEEMGVKSKKPHLDERSNSGFWIFFPSMALSTWLIQCVAHFKITKFFHDLTTKKQINKMAEVLTNVTYSWLFS